VTFTAPSFGRLHPRKAQGRLVLPCHPTAKATAAPTASGPAADAVMTRMTLGWVSRCAPSSYDAQAQVPELWRRTTIAVQRALARLVSLQEGNLRQLVAVSYAKAAEFQTRNEQAGERWLALSAAARARERRRVAWEELRTMAA
jgi:hypothetical protein